MPIPKENIFQNTYTLLKKTFSAPLCVRNLMQSIKIINNPIYRRETKPVFEISVRTIQPIQPHSSSGCSLSLCNPTVY
jgi:hypothetical protein